MTERTDGDGRWESTDGVSWSLVEPSAKWLAARTDDPTPDVAPSSAEDRLDQLITSLTGVTSLAQVRSAAKAAQS